MKTILIPTDFNETSVYLSQGLLNNFKTETVKIIFFHAYKLTDSIVELLMLSRRGTELAQIPDTFHRACMETRIKYAGRVESISVEYFYGNTMVSFRNFAEANEVDMIFYPEDYNFRKISKYSIDPAVFLNKSQIPVIQIIKEAQPETIQIEAITYENVSTILV